MTDELHERAVEAAGEAVWKRTAGYPIAIQQRNATIAIDTYLASLAEQGDPLVRISEVAEWLGTQGGEDEDGYRLCVDPGYLADAIQRRFAPGPEDGA